MQLTVNTGFESLIPPLREEELAGLEQSILTDGCRDPLVIWNNTIIDGHHRYAICTKHSIPFNTTEVQGLDTDIDVKLWMINNQFSRRNLPTETRLALAYRFKEFEAEKAKSRMQATQFKEVDDAAYPLVGSPQIEEFTKDYATQSRGTLGEIAKMAAVGHTTAEQYDAIQRKGTEEQKAEVASGNVSIKKVYTQIQKAERLVFGN